MKLIKIRSLKLLICLSMVVGTMLGGAPAAFAAASWNVVGTVGFGAGTHNNMSLDNNGVPYVAYAASSAIFLKKYVSGSWQDVTTTASFAMRANDMVKVVFDNNNDLYIVFNNTGNGNQVEVDKLDNGEWKHVGNANISTANGYYQNLVFDSQNQPYIAFTDFGQSTKTIVMTLSGGTWTKVGSSQPWNSSTTSPSLGIGQDDSLYVGFVDASDSNQVKVYKYANGTWAMLGSALGTGVNSNYTLKLKMGSGDTPYVDFIDGAQSSKLTVKRFVSGAWETVGSAGFSAPADTFMAFDLDSQDIPYVAFGANSYKANVMRYVDGAWESVGGADFLNDVNRIAVLVNPDDNVYFHYKSTTSTNLGVYLTLLPLTGVQAVGGDGQAVVSFKKPKDATSVIVEQSADSGATWATATTGALDENSTSATVIGLTNGTPYKFRVNVTGGVKPGISNVASATPVAPLADVAGTPGNMEANLTFTAPAGATSVIVEQSTDGGTTWTTAATSGPLSDSSTAATVTGLANGTAYKLRVNVTGGSFPGISNVVDVTPSGSLGNVTAIGGDTTAALSFTAPAGATSVVVEQSTDGGATWTTATTTAALNAASTSAVVTGLVNGTSYTFRVNVVGGTYDGISNTATAKPSAPLTDVAATAGDAQASLTFSAAAGAAAVAVEQSTDGGVTWIISATTGALNPASTSAAVTGLANGTTYKFRVVVTGGAHEGASNEASAMPSQPIADLAATAGNSQASLTFSAATGATAVAVEQSTDGGATWIISATTGALNAGSTDATVTGLVYGTEYRFRVNVTGGAKNGVSNQASAMPFAPLSDLAATTADSQVNLTFSAASGASSVVLEQSTDGGMTWIASTTTAALDSSSTGATVAGLVNGTIYKFRVVVTGGARAGISNPVDAKPSLAIGNLAAVGGNAQANLTFMAASGASSVVVEQSLDNGMTWTAATTTAPVDAASTGATVISLVNGTSYKFRVVVVGGVHEGESNAATSLPSLPLSDVTAAPSDTAAELTFSPATGASAVTVEQSADGGITWAPAATSSALNAGSTSATVTALVNGTSYQFRIHAVGGPHNGVSNGASATPVGKLNNLNASGDDGKVYLTFGAASGASTVIVEQSTDGGITWATAATSGPLTAASTNATVTGLTNNKTYHFRLKLTGGAYAGVSNTASVMPTARSSGPAPTNPLVEIVPVNIDSGKNNNLLSNGTITRTTHADGTKSDNVSYEPATALNTIRKVKDAGLNTVRLVIPDAKDEVANLDVALPKGTVGAIASGKVDFEIYTDNVRIILPQASTAGLEDDLYFRLVPLKKEEERKAVEERAHKEEVVKKAIGSGSAEVVARPMTIETNLSSRAVNLILPLKGVVLPADPAAREQFLSQLVIFIEHSDGERAIAKPSIVTYKDGGLGAAFSVKKFSTFTILKVDDIDEPASQPAVHEAYIQGYPDGTFRPESPITRAEIAAMLTRLQLGKQGSSASLAYADVAADNWAAAAVQYVTTSGLMQGYANSLFAPDRSITRAELAAVIARQQGLHAAEEATASNIAGHWAESYMKSVISAGLMTVDDNGRFRADDKLTRAEAVTVLNRVLKRGPLTKVTAPTWSDTPAAHWAFGDVEEASRTHEVHADASGREVLGE